MDETKPEILSDNSEATINSQQIETLKKHFPQCFDKDGNFIAEKLNEIVSDSGTALSKESYGLNWLGKSYARLLANENPLTLLAEDKEHNQKPENQNSENLLIKGDNLEVLKHLKGAYSESIKMIYIDPPYNTGSDGFVYQDDRKFTPAQLAELAGIEQEEAKRILEFTQSKANSHSAWLTFMYPRLYIARELLKDDGVIFISIDDNELAQLQLLCNEVFGESNFLGQFIINSSPSAIDYGHIAKTHEYALFYAKNSLETKTYHLEDEEKVFKYSDSEGEFNLYPLYNGNVAFNPNTRPNLYYPFYLNPQNKIDDEFYEISLEKKKGWIEVYPVVSRKDRISRVWRWGKPKALSQLNKEIIGYRTDSGEYRIVQKSRLTGKMIRSLHLDKEVSSRRGTGQIEELLGSKVFSFPKPVGLIARFVEATTQDNDLIIDFFAGSGTTAHSVMEQNQKDNGKRNFICVQLPEPTDKTKAAYKAGYKTIFDITEARIEKAAEKIRAENPDDSSDLGFKIFETLPIFEGYLDNIETLEGDTQDLFDGATLTDEQLENLLTTWKVYDGIPLTQPLIETDLADYTAFRHEKVLYLMHQGFKTESLKAFLSKLDTIDGDDKDFDVEKIVLFGYNFDSKNQLEINEAVRQYQNRKEKTISVVVRY